MNYCGNAAAQIFLNKLAEEMADNNEIYAQENESLIDIPFYISILWQRIKNHPEKYKNFLKDITYESYYEIYQKTISDQSIWMVKIYKTPEDLPENLEDLKYYSPTKYEYEINFSYVGRYWGYCECDAADEDYREDYQCCGHGCDWDAPVITISRCYEVDYGQWDGDEHDYWDFEDAFYKDDLELKARIEEEAKRQRIKDLEKQIASYQNDLDMLKKEMNDNESV